METIVKKLTYFYAKPGPPYCTATKLMHVLVRQYPGVRGAQHTKRASIFNEQNVKRSSAAAVVCLLVSYILPFCI